MPGEQRRGSQPPILRLPVATSTMDVAARLAALGYPPWTTVMAWIQTRGRGRRGHAWRSPPGGLWMSMILPPGDPVQQQYTLGAAALKALLEVGAPVEARWPNDIYAAGKKLAGVLVECTGDSCIGGIGVNVSNPPPTRRATSLSSLGVKAGAEALALQIRLEARLLASRPREALAVVNRHLYRGPSWVVMKGHASLCRPLKALPQGLLAECPGGIVLLEPWVVERIYYP